MTNRNKYLLIFMSALVLEIGSTMYINSVADRNLATTMLWAFLGPIIALPFAALIADNKSWRSRIFLALSSSIGYTTGALITMYYIINK